MAYGQRRMARVWVLGRCPMLRWLWPAAKGARPGVRPGALPQAMVVMAYGQKKQIYSNFLTAQGLGSQRWSWLRWQSDRSSGGSIARRQQRDESGDLHRTATFRLVIPALTSGLYVPAGVASDTAGPDRNAKCKNIFKIFILDDGRRGDTLPRLFWKHHRAGAGRGVR